MKKILNPLFSTKTTILLLGIFAVGIGTATFIEEKFDTAAAWKWVYNALWFEFILLLLALNFIGHIGRYHLLRKSKLAGLTFHLAFMILIIGAGITRYTGYSGIMNIRQGASSDAIYTPDPYIQIAASDNGKIYKKDIPFFPGDAAENSVLGKMYCGDKGKIEVVFQSYLKNAVEEIDENVKNGVDIIELAIADNEKVKKFYIPDGESKEFGKLAVAFNNNGRKDAIKITRNDSALNISSPGVMYETDMQQTKVDTILKDSPVALKQGHIYHVEETMFVYTKLHKKAVKKMVEGSSAQMGTSMLVVGLNYKGNQQEVIIHGSPESLPEFETVNLDELNLQIAYGSKQIKLPFSLYLDAFVLERYPGSMSPSSYESKVTLIDPEKNIKEKHRIYMNHVLDYRGYRFYQSSFDQDEKGTILSVNHDFWGTWVSYFGYFLLGIGFLLTLLNKNSRFHTLRKLIKKVRDERKSLAVVMLLVLGLTGITSAQTANQKPVSAEHAEKFGRLIVQTFDGRFEPMHSLAYDVMHKISRQDNFDVEGKGKLDAMQVVMDMIMDPVFWKQQKIIYIREKSVRDVVGTTESHASFNDFFENNHYKLTEFAEKAFRKDPSEQNTFDKEITRVDERLNICLQAFQGSQMKIFPAQGAANNEWVSWNDSLANKPISGASQVINDDLQLNEFNFSNLMQLYFETVFSATQNGDYSRADKIVEYISQMQRQSSLANMLPDKSRIDFEIFYNKAKIFENLVGIYGFLSLVLLSLAFIENLRTKKSRIINIVLNIFIVLLGAAFLYHSFGMGLRWYLTGHAPWSNGYEALLLVSWGGLLAGFCFIRYSKIALAATSLLAFAMLMTAGHSSYDPQLTNLQPVLKSYWLIIHVAVITISYGFLGLGFFLGLMNMFLYLFKSRKNAPRINLLIHELTYINEMNLTIGIILATVGTFLGGIWANESWGKYWGWDAKETWALVIVMVYALILHLRLVPKFRGAFIFSVGSIIGFASVLMTFIGVNYYLSKGLHSYASDETPVFPVWAWMMILSIILLIIVAGIKEKMLNKNNPQEISNP